MKPYDFAASYADPIGSPIRELFPFLSRPGMISFAGGYPSASLFDCEGLREAARVAMEDPSVCLQYGATEGLPMLRESLTRLSASRGIVCDPNQMIVTTGSQQAFDLLVRIFVEPGATVYVESPAYPATLQALRLAGARIVEVPVDGEGLNVECLAQLLEEASDADRPKLLYTVPTFSNPSGALLSLERRLALIDLASQYGFLVVEDDPYGELTFQTSKLPPLYALAQGQTDRPNPIIYLSSLSKTVAPGLRIGWVIGPAEVLRRCAIAKQTADLCTSPLNQRIAAAYLDGDRYFPTVESARLQYRERMLAMTQALKTEVGDQLNFSAPAGGMFLWAECSPRLDGAKLFEEAIAQGVVYVPGTAFFTGGQGKQALRLSYAAPTVAEVCEGVQRLGRAVQRCEMVS